jgi:hypothetical protein
MKPSQNQKTSTSSIAVVAQIVKWQKLGYPQLTNRELLSVSMISSSLWPDWEATRTANAITAPAG